MEKDDKAKKKDKLAAEIFKLSANSLFLNFRFLTKAVTSLPPMPMGNGLATNGRYIFYSPEFVLNRYRQGEKLPIRDHLHVLMHSIFRHWFIGVGIDKAKWDAACDIAVEAVIADTEMFGDENNTEKKKIIKLLRDKIRPLTAEKLYAYFKDIPDEKIAEYNAVFCLDDHKMWYKPEEREYDPEEEHKTIGLSMPENEDTENDEKNSDTSEEEKQNENSENDENNNSKKDENASSNHDKKGFEENDDQEGENDSSDELKQLDAMWKDIAKQIKMELRHFNKNAGDKNADLLQTLEDVDRERYDYSDFLKKFSVIGETVQLDSENFDHNFYSYGLSVYKNVALIEPLEYKEAKLVRNFVIAIDTSGSVSGRLVQNFVKKTYNILNSENSFFKRANIFVIQCDTRIREVVKVTNSKEFEDYIKTMEIRGLGGTDFRPVFEYVGDLIKKGEIKNIKGMIYFTDGYGKFPEKKPPYDTAFVFLRKDYEINGSPEVPPWAIKLVLEENDIEG